MPKRVTEPTAIPDADGFPVVLLPEQVYADNHPIVRAYPNLFVDAYDPGEIIDAPRRAKSVEQATAAPGEKR